MNAQGASCTTATASGVRPGGRRGFSLAELLVVLGITSLLIAIAVPPLQFARRQAIQAKCSAQLQQLGRALEGARSEYGFYPLWDDGGASIRYTWIDVLVQRRLLGPFGEGGPGGRPQQGGAEIGYCPADERPDHLNAARHSDLIYPLSGDHGGIDYSYGIGVPLSAGGWAWRPGQSAGDAGPSRRFRDYDRDTSGRVLAGDAVTSAIYNLSGYALDTGIWNSPTQFDNTVAWGRHAMPASDAPRANLLFQDGHVSAIGYYRRQRNPVNTAVTFVWHPGEPLNVGPGDRYENEGYPWQPPPGYQSDPPGDVFPDEMTPFWYTRTHHWTLITHK